MTDVAPPATSVWYDLGATVDAVLAVLRLADGDVDELRIAALVPAAAGNVDNKVDAEPPAPGREVIVGPPPPAWAQAALEMETVALYRAQSGGTDPYTAFSGAGTGRDALVGGEAVYALVAPHKARWGVA